MNSSKESWLEVALYIAKSKEIQRRAAEIDQKLKAALVDARRAANSAQPEGPLLEGQKAVTEDMNFSDAPASASEVTSSEPSYEQVLILIWK